MIDATLMVNVAIDAIPHSSHYFGPKKSALVVCASNDRFGFIRTCKKCDGSEVWAGGAGSHYFDRELTMPCK